MNLTIQPRDYQLYVDECIWQFFRDNPKNKHPVVVMPTGTGKSVNIGYFVYRALQWFPRTRILVVTHVKELIAQNHEKLVTMWPGAPAGIHSAGLKQKDVMQNVIFCGIGSIAKKAALFGHIDLVLIDEAHLVNPQEEGNYRLLLGSLMAINPALKVIGFTATPWRLGHGSITEGGIFTDVCVDMSGVQAFNWLIREGYLMPLIPKRTKLELDVDGVKKRGGEFIQSELQNAVDKDSITEAALREAMELGHDRNAWLIFASGVEHAIHISEMLNMLGVPCGVVHGNMPDAERDEVIRRFKAGELRAVVNNNVLTTGFDYPAIDLILVLRPTASPVLWVQMLGRGTRPLYAPGFDLSTSEGRHLAIQAAGKMNCLVLDFAGNTRRLGPINDPVVPKKKGEKGGEAPVRICDVCSTYNHASARHCINCGTEFHFQTKLKAAASSMEIIKDDLPVTEIFQVDHITYDTHTKPGSPPCIKVSYYCGLRRFQEYVLLEHPTVAGKARRWWRERSTTGNIPATIKEALLMTGELKTATHLSVWINKKYPEITSACFDGTAFGKQEEPSPAPTVEHAAILPGTPQRSAMEMDDDIPF